MKMTCGECLFGKDKTKFGGEVKVNRNAVAHAKMFVFVILHFFLSFFLSSVLTGSLDAVLSETMATKSSSSPQRVHILGSALACSG